MKKRITFITLVFAMILLICGCTVKVELKQSSFDVELGDKLNISPEHLVDVEKYDSEKMVIDNSAVDTMQIGSYVGVLEYGNQRCEYVVNVVDRTAPVVTLIDESIYVAVGNEIHLSDCIYNITEISGVVKISVADELQKNLKDDQNKVIGNVTFNDYIFSFSELGSYEMAFDVEDESGNSSKTNLVINVINLPNIVAENITVYKGEEESLQNALGEIKVIDDIDGETFDNISYDISQVDANTIGEYPLQVSYTNSKNISNTKEIIVTVKERQQNQTANNSGNQTNNSGTQSNSAQTSEPPKVTVSMPAGANPMVLQYMWRDYYFKDPETGEVLPENIIYEYAADVSPEETIIENAIHGPVRGVWSNGTLTYTSGVGGFSLGDTVNYAYQDYRVVVAYQPPTELSEGYSAYLTENGDLMLGSFNPETGIGGWWITYYIVFEEYGFSYDNWTYY